MNADYIIRLDFFKGLSNVVKSELEEYQDISIIRETDESIYIQFIEPFSTLCFLRSVLRVYVISEDKKYTPRYVANHKSIAGNLISYVLQNSSDDFRTHKIVCAGSDSPEVRSIAEYIQETYNLTEADDADLKFYIIKPYDSWQVGVEITARPLSVRDYKVENMSGAMDPTIAYAVNQLANLSNACSYLNVFSGSATLLIEAGLQYKNLEELVGFDNNKKHLSLAIQNIKKAGLIRKIRLHEKDMLQKPYELGTYDAITSDMPFGMSISKDEDLSELYEAFVDYCAGSLNPKGTLVAYTNQVDLFEKVINQSKFKVIKTVELRYHAYLKPKIFVCKLK
jgi:tRNA (guanine6-N2)-methyltransferase